MHVTRTVLPGYVALLGQLKTACLNLEVRHGGEPAYELFTLTSLICLFLVVHTHLPVTFRVFYPIYQSLSRCQKSQLKEYS